MSSSNYRVIRTVIHDSIEAEVNLQFSDGYELVSMVTLHDLVIMVFKKSAAILALINADEQSLAKAQGKYLVEKGPFDGYYVIHPESNRPVCDCTSKFIAESITNALNRDPITCTHCGKPFTAGDSCGRCGPLRTKSCDFCEQMTSEVMSRDAFIRQLMSAAIETIEAYDEWLANPNEDDDIRLCAAIEAVRRLQAGDSPRVVDKQAAPDVALLDSITRLMSLMKLKENWGHLFGSDRAFSKPSDCPNETLRLVIEAYEDLAGQLEKARAAVEGK